MRLKRDEFDVEEDAPTGLFALRLRRLPSLFFEIRERGSAHAFSVKFSMFDPPRFPQLQTTKTTFKFVDERFVVWLKEVLLALRELQEPDLWAEFSSASSQNSEVFTPAQKDSLRLSITQFKVLITKEFHPTEIQLKKISERLDHLSQSIDKLNQFDWSGVAINTLIAISITRPAHRDSSSFQISAGGFSTHTSLLLDSP